MRTVSKIILCSCIFCYFTGLYIVGVKFGLLKLLTRYGLSKQFEDIPQDYPEMKYLYIALTVYTIIYVIIAAIIIWVSIRHEKEMGQLQQEVSEINDFAEDINITLAKISRIFENELSGEYVKVKLKLLQRQVAALPPNVIRDVRKKENLTMVVSNVKDIANSNDLSKLSRYIDEALDEVKSLQRRSVTRK